MVGPAYNCYWGKCPWKVKAAYVILTKLPTEYRGRFIKIWSQAQFAQYAEGVEWDLDYIERLKCSSLWII